MAYRKGKERAIELSQLGWAAADIADSLKVSLRTVQRWLAELREIGVNSSGANEGNIVFDSVSEFDDNSVDHTKEELDLIRVIQANCKKLCKEDTSELDKKYFGQKYLDFLERLTYYHFLSHASVRVKIQELLNTELAKPEVNLRSVEKLSLALSRHISGEREACDLEVLSASRSAARLWNAGYIISLPSNCDDNE